MGLERLLEETTEAYYWMGFLFADGHFNDKKGKTSIVVGLSEKDRLHLEKLSKFVDVEMKERVSTWTYNGIKKTSKQCNLSKWDKTNVLKIIDKFSILPLKTYNPPLNLNIQADDLFIAFIVGFIDGDGCIDKQGCLHVQCHKSWNVILEQWFNRLYDISGVEIVNKVQKTLLKCSIDKRDGSGRIEIYNNDVLMFLKNKVIEMNLPVLERKWDRIIKRKRYARDSSAIKASIKELMVLGLTQKDIADKVGVGYSYISFIKGGEKRKRSDGSYR